MTRCRARSRWRSAGFHGSWEVPVAGDLAFEVDAADGSEGEGDVELSILADGDPDRSAVDRVLAQDSVGGDPPRSFRPRAREPEGAVGADDDPVGEGAGGERVFGEVPIERHAPDLVGAGYDAPDRAVRPKHTALGGRRPASGPGCRWRGRFSGRAGRSRRAPCSVTEASPPVITGTTHISVPPLRAVPAMPVTWSRALG